MKITTRAKELPAYSQVEGLMVVDYAGGNDSFWLKLDYDSGKGQCIVELSEFEVAQVINAGFKNTKIIEACKRQDYNYMSDFLK